MSLISRFRIIPLWTVLTIVFHLSSDEADCTGLSFIYIFKADIKVLLDLVLFTSHSKYLLFIRETRCFCLLDKIKQIVS